MSQRRHDGTDTTTGLLLMGIAALFGWATRDLTIGSAFRMGPGYFPMILSAILFLLGAIILIRSFAGPGDQPLGKIAWRGMLFILPAPIFFGLTVRGLGFVPSIFLTALIAALASRKLGLLPALVLAALVAGFSTLVFSYALGLPFRRFGPWLNF